MSAQRKSSTRTAGRAAPVAATARPFLVGALLALATPAGASGQSVWNDPLSPPGAWLEMHRPVLAEELVGGDGLTAASSAWFLGGRFRISPALRLVAEVPFAHGEPGSAPIFGSGTSSIGNPYVGLEIARDGALVWYELGARLPLAPEDNFGGVVGLLADPVDRMEAFGNDLVPVSVMVNYAAATPEGFVVRFRGGGVTWFPIGGGDVEQLLGYGGQAGYRNGSFRLLGGISGRALLTEDGGDFAERTLHHAGVTVGFPLGPVEPGFHVGVPLDDDLRDLYDVTWGISLALQGR